MAKDDFTNGVWRTIGGRRIFIRDKESLADAMKRSGKFNNLSDAAIKNNLKVRGLDKDTGETYTKKLEAKEYELYKTAKENPEKIDPMTENSTDWKALDKKYKDRYESEKNTLNFKTQEERMREAGIKFANAEQTKSLQSKANNVVKAYNKELTEATKQRIWAEKTLNEQYKNMDRDGKKALVNNFNKALRKQNELEKKYGKISEEDFKKMTSKTYEEAKEFKTTANERLKTYDDARAQAAKELGYSKHTSNEKQNREIYERQQKIIKNNPQIKQHEDLKENAYKQAAKELGYARHTSDYQKNKEISNRANEIINYNSKIKQDGYKTYLKDIHGTDNEELINVGKEKDQRVSYQKYKNETVRAVNKYRMQKGTTNINTAYRNAYEEYKRLHPYTKLSLRQFIKMSEGE